MIKKTLIYIFLLISMKSFPQGNYLSESFFSQLKLETKEKENFKLGYSFDSQFENKVLFPNIYHFSKISLRYASDKLKKKNIEIGCVLTPLYFNNKNNKTLVIPPVTLISEPQNDIYSGISAGLALIGRSNIDENSFIEGGIMLKTNRYNHDSYSANKNSNFGVDLMFLLKSKNIGIQSHLIINSLINPININLYGIYIFEDFLFSDALITSFFIENKPGAELFFSPYLSFVTSRCIFFNSDTKIIESKPGFNLYIGLKSKIDKSEIFFEYGETVLNNNYKNGFYGVENNLYTASFYHSFNKFKPGISVSYYVKYYMDYWFVLVNRKMTLNFSIIYSL